MDEVLHTLRVKGIATPESLAAALGADLETVVARLDELAAAGIAFERPSRRRPGWVLSEEGRERHAADLAAAHPPETRATLAQRYEGFLALNSDVKMLAARWQQAGSDDDRFELLDRLEGVHELAAQRLSDTGTVVPRFGRYAVRLESALHRIDEDPRFFVSPLVDSYHNVWFECHEDFLLTLGRTRAEEGSE
jgi:DNA-binding MarR family transcriptional regulator